MDLEQAEPPSFWRSPAELTLLVAIGVGGFYLVTEHTAHVFDRADRGAAPMNNAGNDYSLWGLVLVNSVVFIGFAYSHDAGHLWWLLTGQHGNPHFGALHVLSFAFLFAGFTLLSKAWHVLHHAQRGHALAKTGPYGLVRHPQYIGFVAIMFGFLLQ
jgi:protein-S-isoprenylcysteine O-methyltransferase Ste14